MTALSSRDNPKVKRWLKLAEDARYRRSERRTLVDGVHLLATALKAGVKPVSILVTERSLQQQEIASLVQGLRPIVMTERLLRRIADTGVAAEIPIPEGKFSGRQAVFLEGVQDPGNVGAVIRSAAAFGAGRVVLDEACADPWSPKCLRAGMGGHFALEILVEKSLRPALDAFKGRLLCTVPRGGTPLKDATLGDPGWIFGAEGRGVSEEVRRRALGVTIPMAAGTESLNVAAAAAVCLYEAFSRSDAGS